MDRIYKKDQTSTDTIVHSKTGSYSKKSSSSRFIFRNRFITIAFLLFSSTLFSDTVYLKNGQSITGKVIRQSRQRIQIRLKNGNIKSINKARIRRTRFGPVKDIKKEQELKRKQAELARINKKKEQEEKERLEKQRKLDEELRLAEEQKRKEQLRRDRQNRLDQQKIQDKKSKPDTSDPEIDKWGALWRSAIIPGWGQWARGEKVTGGLFAAGTILGGVALYETNRIYLNSVDDANSLNNPFSENIFVVVALGATAAQIPTLPAIQDPVFFTLYNQPFVEQRARLANQLENQRIAGATIAFVYIWNLVDAFFFHPANAADSSHSRRFEQSLVRMNHKKAGKHLQSRSRSNANQLKSSVEDWFFYPVMIQESNGISYIAKKSSVRHELHFTRRIQF